MVLLFDGLIAMKFANLLMLYNNLAGKQLINLLFADR